MRNVEIVFFDAGHTLLFTYPRVGEVYAQAGRRYGLSVSPDGVEAAFRDAFVARKLDGRPQDRAWWRRLVLETFGRFGEASDPEALFADLYEHFTHPASWRLYEGALETLEALQARGYRTGLISNWDDRLPELLEGLGLVPLLEPRVISTFVGVEKPHRRIFETALAEAGVEPGQALMVGDDWEADVLGARAVGMHAVHVRANGHTTPDGVGIGRLGELLDWLPGRDLPEAQGRRQAT